MNRLTYDNASIFSQITAKLQDILEVQEEIPVDEELNNWGLDSIRSVSLIVELEELYQIAFDDDELLYENFSTIEKIIARVEGKLC